MVLRSTCALGFVNASIGTPARLITPTFVALELTGPSSLALASGSTVLCACALGAALPLATPLLLESITLPSMVNGFCAALRVAPKATRATAIATVVMIGVRREPGAAAKDWDMASPPGPWRHRAVPGMAIQNGTVEN